MQSGCPESRGAMGTLLVPTRLGMWFAIKEHRLAFEGNERKSFLQLLAAGCGLPGGYLFI